MRRLATLSSLALSLAVASLAASDARADAVRSDDPISASVIAAPAFRASLSAGYGVAWDGAGLALEAGRGHFAGSIGFGSDAFSGPPDAGPRGRTQGSLSLAGRWFSGNLDDAVLSLHASGTSWDGWQTHGVGAQGRLAFGASAGWRVKLGQQFLEAAFGAAARYQRYDVQLASAAPVKGWSVAPDFSVGAGTTF